MEYIQDINTVLAVVRIFGFAVFSFILGIFLTPFLTDFLFRTKLGKNIREESWDNDKTPIFNKFHKHKQGTPTMAGILFWCITAVLTLLFNLTRSETFLPVAFLISAGLLGAIDDIANIRGIGKIKGLGVKLKLGLQLLIAGFGAYWFTFKLNWTSFHIPGGALLGLPTDIELGYWYIPVFIILVVFIMNAVDITDGLDGLLAGSIIPPLGVLSALALAQGNISLAVFMSTLIGALVAFLWFNIHPARFFMGGTGAFPLGAVLAVGAMLTNSLVILPIIGFLFFVEGTSSILQMLSKKLFKRKIFLAAPIHHHFQSLGWTETKIVMRFWIISLVMSVIGLTIGLLGL
ncbi:MAG: phospho-N-acetylmuramoyl-pentapeptide transferase [Candidatus Parcubacteria bacterium]|jgi:phospho-N-acetylmuramoyl-pentapeptide-transferase